MNLFTSFYEYLLIGFLPFVTYGLYLLYMSRAMPHDSIPNYIKDKLPLIGQLYALYRHALSHDLNKWLFSILKNYVNKPVCFPCFNKQYIFVQNIDVIKYLLDTKSYNFNVGKAHYNRSIDVLGCGILNINGALWDTQHDMLVKCLKDINAREAFFDMINDDIGLFIDKCKDLSDDSQYIRSILVKKINGKNYVDVEQIFLRFTLGFILKIVLGKGNDFGCIDKIPESNPFVNAFNMTIYYYHMRMFNFFGGFKKRYNIGFEKYIKRGMEYINAKIVICCEKQRKRMKMYQKLKKKYDEQQRKIKQINHAKKAQQKLNENIDRKDNQKLNEITDDLYKMDLINIDQINAYNKEYSFMKIYLDTFDDINLTDLRDHLFNIICAMRNDISMLITWFIYEINRNKLQNNIYNDIKKVDNISANNIHNSLKYIENCLYETLRLHPTKSWIIKQANKDTQIPKNIGNNNKEYIIKCDDYVVIHQYTLGKLDTLYKDPSTFNPDRWNNKNTFKFMFGFGERICLGNQFGIHIGKLIIYHFYKNFDIHGLNDDIIDERSLQTPYLMQPFYVKLLAR